MPPDSGSRLEELHKQGEQDSKAWTNFDTLTFTCYRQENYTASFPDVSYHEAFDKFNIVSIAMGSGVGDQSYNIQHYQGREPNTCNGILNRGDHRTKGLRRRDH